MVGCAILGCKSRSERNIEQLTFHTFPTNSNVIKKWVDATGRQNWGPTKYSRICSIHFDKESFIYKKKKVVLKPYSIPKNSIHINIQSDLCADDCNEALSTQPSTSHHDYTLITVFGLRPRKYTIDTFIKESGERQKTSDTSH